MSPLMSPKKCDEEAGPDLMTQIRSTKTDSKIFQSLLKYFNDFLLRTRKTSSSLDFPTSITEVVRLSRMEINHNYVPRLNTGRVQTLYMIGLPMDTVWLTS